MRGKAAKAARQAANRFFSNQDGIPQGLLGDSRTARYFYLVKPAEGAGVVKAVPEIIKTKDADLQAEAGKVVVPLFATYTLCYHPGSLRRRYKAIKRIMKRNRRAA